MADHIRKATGPWVVRVDGAVVAESAAALELTEGSYPPVIYFPRGDVSIALFDRTETKSTCPWKGQASYFSISTPAGTLRDVAWSYETPKAEASDIAGHLAFYPDRIVLERL